MHYRLNIYTIRPGIHWSIYRYTSRNVCSIWADCYCPESLSEDYSGLDVVFIIYIYKYIYGDIIKSVLLLKH